MTAPTRPAVDGDVGASGLNGHWGQGPEDSPSTPPTPESEAQSVIGYFPGPAREALSLAGGITQLGAEVIWKTVRHPLGNWKLTLDEMYSIVRQSFLPLVLAVSTFDVLTEILGVDILGLLGGSNRYAELFEYGSIREFSDWIMAIVIAGIVGSSLCADLGARKVREELDALKVLGTDPVRELVQPRVIATTLVTPLMLVFSVTIGLAAPAFTIEFFGNVPAVDFYHNMLSSIDPVILIGATAEAVIFGFVIGIVSAYKGMHCSSGPIGVGRAVNQSVVMIFVLIFVIDFIFMNTLVGLTGMPSPR